MHCFDCENDECNCWARLMSSMRTDNACAIAPTAALATQCEQVMALFNQCELVEFHHGHAALLRENPMIEQHVRDCIVPTFEDHGVKRLLQHYLRTPMLRFRTDQAVLLYGAQRPRLPHCELMHRDTVLLVLYLTAGKSIRAAKCPAEQLVVQSAQEVLGSLQPLQDGWLSQGSLTVRNASVVHGAEEAQESITLLLPVHSTTSSHEGFPNSDESYDMVTMRMMACDAEPTQSLRSVFEWQDLGYDVTDNWPVPMQSLVASVRRHSTVEHIHLSKPQAAHWAYYWKQDELACPSLRLNTFKHDRLSLHLSSIVKCPLHVQWRQAVWLPQCPYLEPLLEWLKPRVDARLYQEQGRQYFLISHEQWSALQGLAQLVEI